MLIPLLWRTWAPRGRTPLVRHVYRRERLSVISALTISLRRRQMFIFFGVEEQEVKGSEFYLNNLLYPLEKTIAFINLDGVGCGDKLNAIAGKNFPEFWKFIKKANERYIHRQINPTFFANIARPRLDAARFMWKNVPTISFSVSGAPSFYHITKDNIDTINPRDS